MALCPTSSKEIKKREVPCRPVIERFVVVLSKMKSFNLLDTLYSYLSEEVLHAYVVCIDFALFLQNQSNSDEVHY